MAGEPEQVGYTPDPEVEPEQTQEPEPQYGPGAEDLRLPDEGETQPTGQATSPAAEPTAPAEQPAEPYFDDEVLAYAQRNHGWTPDQVRSLGTVEAAVNAMSLIENARATQQPSVPANVPTQQPQVGQLPSLFAITVNEEETPGLTGQLQAVNDGVSNALVYAAEAITKQQEQLDALQTAMFEMEFDSAVSELGTDWESELGKGRMRDMDRKTDAYTSRSKLRDRVNLERRMRAGNGTMPTAHKLTRESLPIVFSDRFKAQAREELTQKVDTFAGQSIGRPSSVGRATVAREANTPAGREAKAADKVDVWRRLVGANVPE